MKIKAKLASIFVTAGMVCFFEPARICAPGESATGAGDCRDAVRKEGQEAEG